MTPDLRQGRWQDALADVTCDALICDPPYGARTHAGQVDDDLRRGLSYAHWTPDDVREFVASWSPRTRGWMVCMTGDDLIPVWREAYRAAGRLDFAPVPILQHRLRLSGDGPASCAVYLMVARPRTREAASCGSLPGWYGPHVARKDGHIGGKPLVMMREVLRDYAAPGSVVCDPCAGYATTLIAALERGCTAIGAECDPQTHASGAVELARFSRQPMLLPVQVEQPALL